MKVLHLKQGGRRATLESMHNFYSDVKVYTSNLGFLTNESLIYLFFFLSPYADNLVLNIIKLLLNKTVRPLKIQNFVDHPRNWFSVVQLSQMQRG